MALEARLERSETAGVGGDVGACGSETDKETRTGQPDAAATVIGSKKRQ